MVPLPFEFVAQSTSVSEVFDGVIEKSIVILEPLKYEWDAVSITIFSTGMVTGASGPAGSTSKPPSTSISFVFLILDIDHLEQLSYLILVCIVGF